VRASHALFLGSILLALVLISGKLEGGKSGYELDDDYWGIPWAEPYYLYPRAVPTLVSVLPVEALEAREETARELALPVVGVREGERDTTDRSERAGVATWYGGPLFNGKPMANGESYNPWAMTAASNNYPLGTVLEVEYRSIITVTVTDRGGFGHLLDLSQGAFHGLVQSNEPGVISVTVRMMQ